MPICNPVKRVRIGQMKTPTSKAGKQMGLGCLDSDEISKKAIFVFGIIRCCREMFCMRSSRVLYSVMTANSKDATSLVQSQHPPTQWNLRAADEAVLNKVIKKDEKV